ncbi:MAG TPA: hypothetical protein VF551_06400 [Chthoniobacterales bacterium]
MTIAASAIVALVLQLDAVEIFHYVSTNAAGRSALVTSAGKVIAEADGALDERGRLIRRIADRWAERFLRVPMDLTGIDHLGELEAALRKQSTPFDPAVFEEIVASTTKEYFRDQRDKISELTRAVSATGFEFIPLNYWRWTSERGVGAKLLSLWEHLPGMALFAALLTLGAPYWYNLLKNLTSLRPAVAQLIGKEQAPREERVRVVASSA